MSKHVDIGDLIDVYRSHRLNHTIMPTHVITRDYGWFSANDFRHMTDRLSSVLFSSISSSHAECFKYISRTSKATVLTALYFV